MSPKRSPRPRWQWRSRRLQRLKTIVWRVERLIEYNARLEAYHTDAPSGEARQQLIETLMKRADALADYIDTESDKLTVALLQAGLAKQKERDRETNGRRRKRRSPRKPGSDG